MKTTLLILLLCGCSLFLPAINNQSQAAMPTPEEIATRLQERYNSTTALSAEFSQATSSSLGSRRVKRGSGTMLLLKPGRMRWDYSLPDYQVIVCDGENISMYFAREQQLIISPAKQYLESDVAYSFFAGSGNLLNDFTVGPADEENLIPDPKAALSIKIIPKESHPQVDYIMLWADPESYLIKRLKVIDKFGSVTDIRFTNIILEPAIAAEAFSFTAPPNTEIIRQ